MDIRKLKEAAVAVRENAYVPYSEFKVGAALMDGNGHIHAGCNVENAAYAPTNCAERTALFRAIADGATAGSFRMMAVVADMQDPVSPCGVCRQVLIELCSPDMPVFMGNIQGEWVQSTVSQLLPGAFGPKSLERLNDSQK
ncbi:MAG: cytidine deaminase [Paenibacillaceae bacterium]